MAYLVAAIVMNLIVFEGLPLLQAFSSVIFGICGASRGPSASAELLVNFGAQIVFLERLKLQSSKFVVLS